MGTSAIHHTQQMLVQVILLFECLGDAVISIFDYKYYCYFGDVMISIFDSSAVDRWLDFCLGQIQ